jgi:hypothetical protein
MREENSLWSLSTNVSLHLFCGSPLPPLRRRASPNHMSDARAKAVHECNIRAAKYKQYTWGVTEVTTYRACMAEHGQQE